MTSSDQSNPPVFPLKSPTNFGWLLGIPSTELKRLAKVAGRYYSPFINKKGRPIDNPTGELKVVQKKINSMLLVRYPYPEYIIGGVKGKTIGHHLELHINKPVVITLDIRKCFPSITNAMVYQVWRQVLGGYPDTARLATQLTTFQGHLPLGAPTSTLLAALVMLPCLEKVRALAEAHGFCHTQFVDDAALSGEKLSKDLITMICKEFSRHRLPIKRDKVKVQRSNQPQIITKMLVNKKPARQRPVRNNLRSAIKQLQSMDVNNPATNQKFLNIKGQVAYLKKYHPKVARKLDLKLSKIEFPTSFVFRSNG